MFDSFHHRREYRKRVYTLILGRTRKLHGKGTGFCQRCRLAWHIGTACGPMGLRVYIVNDIY